MKLKQTLLTLTALLGVTITTSFAGNPSAKSKADKAKVKARSEEVIPGAAVQPATYFYTGKPYDEDLGGYVFNYRTYSPGINRWTTPDPSGFPDGTNNFAYVANPNYSLDPFGLRTYTYTGTVYGIYEKNSGGSISMVGNAIGTVGGLLTKGTLNLVFAAIGGISSLAPNTAVGYTKIQIDDLSGWDNNEKPPATGSYSNLVVHSPASQLHDTWIAYKTNDPNEQGAPFVPIENGVIWAAMENGQTPHPDVWNEQTGGGYGYPGTSGFHQRNVTILAVGWSMSINVE